MARPLPFGSLFGGSGGRSPPIHQIMRPPADLARGGRGGPAGGRPMAGRLCCEAAPPSSFSPTGPARRPRPGAGRPAPPAAQDQPNRGRGPGQRRGPGARPRGESQTAAGGARTARPRAGTTTTGPEGDQGGGQSTGGVRRLSGPPAAAICMAGAAAGD